MENRIYNTSKTGTCLKFLQDLSVENCRQSPVNKWDSALDGRQVLNIDKGSGVSKRSFAAYIESKNDYIIAT